MPDNTCSPPYRKLASLGLSLALYAATGCGDGSDLDGQMFQPPPTSDGGFTTDASAVGTGSLPPLGAGDSGVAVVAQPDTGVAATIDAGPSGTVSTPEGGSAVPDTGAGEGGSPEGGAPARPDQGMGDGKDVIAIGDSWMNLDNSVGIQESLLKVSKRPFRTFGVPGTKLLDEVIPKQFTTAKMQGDVKTVVMTAGGNDVLQDVTLGPINILGPGCSDSIFNDACKKRIDEVAARLQKLWADMAAAGVADVLIISYSNKTLGGNYTKVAAYSSEKITPICNAVPAPLRCSTFDTDMNVSFKDRGDGIHPDNPTYDAIGTAVWKVMQEKGMRR